MFNESYYADRKVMPVQRSLKGELTEDSVAILFKGQRVGTLTRYMNDACEEEYVFRIDWNEYDRVGATDIQGLDMSLRLDEYVRPFKPRFMTCCMPPRTRQDINELMVKVGLSGEYDMWEYMKACRRITDDNYTVEPI